MDRMKILRRILTAAGLALALALLGTCSNQFSLLGTLTDQVKISTGKYLVINSVTPVQSASDVNPGVRIAIVFDRALDESTAIASNILISPSEDFVLDPPEFNALSRTLYVQADPYLADNTDYTIQLTKGLRGADGSELRSEYAWGFQTGQYPAGSINICKAGETTKAVATNNRSVNLKFTWNTEVTQLRYDFDPDFTGISYQLPGSLAIQPDGTKAVSLDDFGQGSADGPYVVYVQFWGAKGESEVGSDTIIQDTVLPTAIPGAARYINIANQATGVTPITTVSDGAGSGIEDYEWTDPYAAGLSFSAADVQYPYINIGTDGTYTARLRVKDYADNWSANCDVTIKRDTIAPVVTFAVNPSEYADWWELKEHPTVKQMPTWTWTGSEAGTFDVNLTDIGGRSLFRDEKFKETSYQYSKQFENSLYTLTVTERDAAGNWSASSKSWTFLVTPVIPMHKSTAVPLDLYCQWRAYTGAHHYIFYLKGLEPVTVTAPRCPQTTTQTIPPGEYTWYYKACDSRGATIYTSPTYSFATVKE
jgi:hypothetical protein